MSNTINGGGTSLEDFKACEKLTEGIWLVTTDDRGLENKNVVIQLSSGEKRKLFARNYKSVKPLDAKNWCHAAKVFLTELASQGMRGGSPGAYGICHVDIGEILPRPAGFDFDPKLHTMPKEVMCLSSTLFLLDSNRLLEICGDHVKFCALPFSIRVKAQISVDPVRKHALVATGGSAGVHAVIFDYKNGKTVQEVRF